MMHCSEKARALCSHRRCCGAPEPVEIPTDGWCAGFNAGVAKALTDAREERDPSPAAQDDRKMAAQDDTGIAAQDDRKIADRDDQTADKEGSDGRT